MRFSSGDNLYPFGIYPAHFAGARISMPILDRGGNAAIVIARWRIDDAKPIPVIARVANKDQLLVDNLIDFVKGVFGTTTDSEETISGDL